MRSLLSGPLRRGWGSERGQVLALFGMGLAGFIGLVGLSVDMGQVVFARTDLQKLADSATFAAAQDLPDSTKATAAANTYGHSDQFPGTLTVVISQTYGANDTVEVTASRRVNYWFLKAVGLDGMTVTAKAKARAMNYAGGAGLLPWGFIASNEDNSKLLQNSCYTGQTEEGVPTFQQNVPCTVKYGAGTNAGGDFGALALDGTGANIYRESIAKGSTKTFMKGQQVDAETGNMQGPTGQGLADRLALPAILPCPGNLRSQVLTTDPVSGASSITSGCESSPRIGIIPVVNKIDNPQKSTILGFAFVFIEGTSGSGGGSSVNVYFVKFVTILPNGVYTGTTSSGATAIKLVE